MSAPRRSTANQQGAGSAAPATRAGATSQRAPVAPPPVSSKPVERDRGKAQPAAQPSVMATRIQSVRIFIREVISEGKKVNWPDRETTISLTGVVIAVSAVLGLLLGGIDFVLIRILEAF